MSKTAFIYVRQSKESDNNVSPAQQEAHCRRVPEVAVADRVVVFSDLGVSGELPMQERPGAMAMLEAIDQAQGSVIVIADVQSRYTREVEDGGWFYKRMRKMPNVKLWTKLGEIPKTSQGAYMWGMEVLADDRVRQQFSEKMTDTLSYLNSAGMATGQTPFGYTDVYRPDPASPQKKQRWFERDPQTAPIVERMFSQYATGTFTTRQIAELLQAEGVEPVGARKGKWTPDRVAALLTSDAYRAKTYTVSRPHKQGDLIDAKWPALVDDALWQRVQDRLKAHAPNFKEERKQRDYVFKGLLYCQHCARRFTAQWSHNAIYYRCGSALQVGEPCDMGKHALFEADLLPVIDQLIGDFFNGVALPGTRPKVKTETAAQALAKIKAQQERNQELYVDGDRDRAKYTAEKTRMVALAASYEEQDTPMPDKAELLTLGEMWRDGDVAQRWKVLSSLFERIELRDRKIVGFKPRADRVGRVRLLINTAIDYAIGFDEEADAAMAEGPGALNISGSGEGGIRTLEGALHPLPA
jgi:DNA invertase Pin-like site-specific DNA recombinase